MRSYNRLPGDENQGQGHELQDLHPSDHQGSVEEREDLLRGYENGEESLAEGSGEILGESRGENESQVHGVSASESASASTSSAPASTSTPHPSIPSNPNSNSRRARVPNTIIHRILNDARISKYVPRLVHDYYQPRYNGRPMGQGLNNDGVFTNMAAKPSTHDEVSENLPSYEQLAMDLTPPYWESSVISPGFEDEVFVDGLPVGSILIFIWNFVVSFSFQFIGFFLTYLLHTSHGSKEGSRAGLGLTFMNYGYGLLPVNYYSRSDSPIYKFEPDDPNSIDVVESQDLAGEIYGDDTTSDSKVATTKDDLATEDNANTPVLSFALIALGLFIILKAVIDYHRARQMERMILNPNYGTTTAPEQVTRTEPEEV